MTPILYLIPSPLGEEFDQDDFPKQIKSVIEKLDYFIVENEKEWLCGLVVVVVVVVVAKTIQW